MTIEEVVRMKERFVTRKIGEEMVLVPLQSNVASMDEMFRMNSTACFIWDCMDEKTTREEVVQKVQDEFDVASDVAEKDLNAFLNVLESL